MINVITSRRRASAMITTSLLVLFSLLNLTSCISFNISKNTVSQDRMAWWRNARFGMFIHWGLYAIPAGEWKGKTGYAEWIRHQAKIPMDTYDKFREQFNPVKFNADEWVSIAKDAGMKYMVITSKHHDGFCLWDSKETTFDIASTPFKRDILGELKKACDKQGITFCVYYSIMDWHHPDYPPRNWEKDRKGKPQNFDRYVKYMKAQLKELVTNYHPAVIWFDGEWEKAWNHKRGVDLYKYVRSLDPNVIINNRVDKGRRGMEGMTKNKKYVGDFGTPEQRIPAKGFPGVDWESCMTMNRHWGWNKNDHSWKSSDNLIKKLVDIASKGGNYLLNVGPKPDGTFPNKAKVRLKEMGEWMSVNGDAIYGTQASPVGKVSFGRVTSKPQEHKLYLELFKWPKKTGNITINKFKAPVEKVSLLGNPEHQLSYMVTSDGGIKISNFPTNQPSKYVSVIELKYR